MIRLILLLFIFPPILLSGQLVISNEFSRNGFSHALNVEVWGENYLVRTSEQTFLPFNQVDNIFFPGPDGGAYPLSSFNPYDGESSFTQTDFTVLTDSFAVALAMNLGEEPGGGSRLTRFRPNGDTSLTRDFSSFSFFPNSLCSAGDSKIFAVGRGIEDEPGCFTVRALSSDFEDIYALKFEDLIIEDSRMIFNTLHVDTDGKVHVVYERKRELPGQGFETDFFVAAINLSGEVINERSVNGPDGIGELEEDYTAVLPVGEEGVALLEGILWPEQICAGSACIPNFGSLFIYRDATSPREVYRLNFAPFGMELLPNGDLFVYGANYLFGDDSRGVLFNPTGWPDGNRIHILNDPNATGQEPVAYNRIYGMDVADNGDLVGTGVIGYGENGSVDDSHWLFRMGPSGCFTADCSDLAENPGDLVPTTTLTQNLAIKTHPNPFATQLNFTILEDRPRDPITVSLHDLSGRLLRSGKLEDGLEWATHDLSEGVYLVTFTSGVKRGVVKVVKR